MYDATTLEAATLDAAGAADEDAELPPAAADGCSAGLLAADPVQPLGGPKWPSDDF